MEHRSEHARVQLGVALGNAKDYLAETDKLVRRLESETVTMEGYIDSLCLRVEQMAGHSARAVFDINQGNYQQARERLGRNAQLAADILSMIGWGRGEP